jgi:hypothetical protein
MEHSIVRYQGMTEEQLRGLPEEQILGICHDLLVYCNHTLRATSEGIRASLAKCDAIDAIGELYRTARKPTTHDF